MAASLKTKRDLEFLVNLICRMQLCEASYTPYMYQEAGQYAVSVYGHSCKRVSHRQKYASFKILKQFYDTMTKSAG